MWRLINLKSFIVTAFCVSMLSLATPPTALAGKAHAGDLGEAPPVPNSTDPKQRAFQEFAYDSYQVRAVLTREVLADPTKRQAVAAQAIPLLYKQIDAIEGMLKFNTKTPAASAEVSRRQPVVDLYLLQDPPTVKRVKDMLASPDAAQQLTGQIIDLESRWLTTEKDIPQSAKLADELEKLDQTHTDDSRLTILTNRFALSDRSPQITAQMRKASDAMQDPMTLGVKKMAADRAARADSGQSKQAALLNKPMVIAGKTADGKDFTTADWKGKVVLVDFWATWCGPCVAGLPHVKDLYTKYHDKGLEVIGVDNDYNKDAMEKFVAKHEMPWPDLFDSTLDADHKYSDVTRANFVYGIPTAFLIDRKGVLHAICVGPFTLDDQIEKLLAE